MAQTEFVRPGRLRPGSMGPTENSMVTSASMDFGVSETIDVDEISDFYSGAYGLVSTWIRSINPNATLTPVDDDLHALFLESAGTASRVESLTALQEWEGRVVAIYDDEFVALLVDVTAAEASSQSEGDIEDEEAVIPISAVDEHDLKHLREGGIFRWVIGYGYLPGGRRRRISDIVFRDLPAVTVHDRALGEAWAGEDLTILTGLTDLSTAPQANEVELSLAGPGYGECVLIHVGNNTWVIVDSWSRCEPPTSGAQLPRSPWTRPGQRGQPDNSDSLA